MQGVGPIVYGKVIFFAVEGKVSFGYAVCKASGNFSGARAVGDIVGGVSVAYGNVSQNSVAVRYNN